MAHPVQSAQTSLDFEREESKRAKSLGVNPSGARRAQCNKLAIQRMAATFDEYVRRPGVVGDEDKVSQREFAERTYGDESALRLFRKNGGGLSVPWWLEALRQTTPEALAHYLESHLADLARVQPHHAARAIEHVIACLPDDVASELLRRAEHAFVFRKTEGTEP